VMGSQFTALLCKEVTLDYNSPLVVAVRDVSELKGPPSSAHACNRAHQNLHASRATADYRLRD
jgi:hypothetical protein